MENTRLSRIRGCLLGGAVGDALGYPVEFIKRKEILKTYGENGITTYELDRESGLAFISDDTQMTLFTANGLLSYDTTLKTKGFASAPLSYILKAYRDWYACQTQSDAPKRNTSWLSCLSEMHMRRAPGLTCMHALGSGRAGSVDAPENNSKGCGGVMRVAPIALYYKDTQDIFLTDMLSAESAALTHGHPLGYISAAALSHIVSRAAFGGTKSGEGLKNIVRECKEAMKVIFPDTAFADQMNALLDRAEELSQNDESDAENIALLGEGWVGEEALAISVYCALRYESDFDKAIIAAVNHSGDSDSTGAITGNIMGALLGEEAISVKWRQNLELKDCIFEIADDLFTGCVTNKKRNVTDPDWERKYVRHGKI